jgi:hypothetical protein
VDEDRSSSKNLEGELTLYRHHTRGILHRLFALTRFDGTESSLIEIIAFLLGRLVLTDVHQSSKAFFLREIKQPYQLRGYTLNISFRKHRSFVRDPSIWTS